MANENIIRASDQIVDWYFNHYDQTVKIDHAAVQDIYQKTKLGLDEYRLSDGELHDAYELALTEIMVGTVAEISPESLTLNINSDNVVFNTPAIIRGKNDFLSKLTSDGELSSSDLDQYNSDPTFTGIGLASVHDIILPYFLIWSASKIGTLKINDSAKSTLNIDFPGTLTIVCRLHSAGEYCRSAEIVSGTKLDTRKLPALYFDLMTSGTIPEMMESFANELYQGSIKPEEVYEDYDGYRFSMIGLQDSAQVSGALDSLLARNQEFNERAMITLAFVFARPNGESARYMLLRHTLRQVIDSDVSRLAVQLIDKELPELIQESKKPEISQKDRIIVDRLKIMFRHNGIPLKVTDLATIRTYLLSLHDVNIADIVAVAIDELEDISVSDEISFDPSLPVSLASDDIKDAINELDKWPTMGVDLRSIVVARRSRTLFTDLTSYGRNIDINTFNQMVILLVPNVPLWMLNQGQT